MQMCPAIEFALQPPKVYWKQQQRTGKGDLLQRKLKTNGDNRRRWIQESATDTSEGNAEEILPSEGAEALILEKLCLSCPQSIQGQVWSNDLVDVVPAQGRGWNKMGFKVHSGILNEHLSYSQVLQPGVRRHSGKVFY